MSSLSLYQPTISRNAVGRTFFRGTRQGTPAPDHSPRPNLYPPQVWRPPRSKPGTRHDYVPPLVHETQHQLPWRAERQRQRRKESPIFGHGTRRDEAGRVTNTAASVEQPASYQPLFAEQDRGHRRYPRVPRERIRYPERRPSRARHVSPNAQEDHWRELPSGHRTSEQQWYGDHPRHFNERPRYDHDLDRDRCRHIPRRERHSTSFDPLYNSPSSPYDNMLPTSSHGGTKRWSWSSDSSSSSTNSAVSWSSSSPTIHPSSLTLPTREVRPNPHESDIRFRHPETNSHWSRTHGVETTNGWMADDYFIPSGDLSVVDNDEYVRSPSTDHYSGEDGETVVYTDCEIVARDSRIAGPHQRMRGFDGMSVVQFPREVARGLDPLSSSDVDRAERSRRVESRETRRRKRPYELPFWSELPPRNLRRAEGIRFRYPRDSDDTPEPENGYPELPYKMDDHMRSFPPRQRRRQETFRQHYTSH
ncbi:hypothetical protein JOM56_004440 [Amanita muscaria]